jgi:hypothetical protein
VRFLRIAIAVAVLLCIAASPAAAEVRALKPVRDRGRVLTFNLSSLKGTTVRKATLRFGRKKRKVKVARVRAGIRRGRLRIKMPRRWVRAARRAHRPRHWARRRVRLVITADRTSPTPVTPGALGAGRRVYAYYYLWWSQQHWHDKLGSSYPYDENPLPLPATLDASGCNPVSRYPGNQLTDVPAMLYGQDDPGLIERHIRLAANAGLAGFLVNWAGTGSAGQTSSSVTYSRRLDALFSAVRKVNAEGIPFKIWISYKGSSMPPVDAILNDLDYLARTYGNDSAYDHAYSSRPVFVWTGSRKYPLGAIRTVSERFRSRFFLVGDETESTWSDGRSAYFDGDSYYWSSQDPYGNPQSFAQVRSLATKVRASGANPDGSRKLWFAPVTPGYNSQLSGGSTCVPRNDGQTMQLLFQGNAASNPDGWTLISWNEISEGSYIEPLQRYGSRYLDVVGSVIRGP